MPILYTSTSTLWPSNDNFVFAINPWLRWYAIFFILGLFIGIFIACMRAQSYYKLKLDLFFYFAILVVPISLLGARFWSACIGDLDWQNFFKFGSAGGLAIQGGVVFSAMTGLIYFPLILRKPKYHVRVEKGNNVYILKPSLWIVIDVILPCILIGQAIGRWGNFFNGEIYGTQTSAASLEWLQNIMPGVFERMSSFTNGISDHIYYQPLFLYESLLNTIIFAIIYFILPNVKKIKIGVIGSSYFIIYGITRFAFEPLRQSQFSFQGTYILNGLLLALGIILIIFAQLIAPRFRNKKIIYACYLKWIRVNVIKVLKPFNISWVKQALLNDPELKNFGFKKPISFIRNEEESLYFANK